MNVTHLSAILEITMGVATPISDLATFAPGGGVSQSFVELCLAAIEGCACVSACVCLCVFVCLSVCVSV